MTLLPSAPEPGSDPAAPFAAAAEEALRVDPVKLEQDRTLVLGRFWNKLRDAAARIPFLEDVLAGFYAATDSRTPFQAKAILMGALSYFIMPVDAVPDVLAMLGYTDDATVLMLAIRTVREHLRPEHRDRARAWLVAHRTRPTTQDEVAAGPVLDHETKA